MKKKLKLKRLPVAKQQCATCPFRKGSKYAGLRNDLANHAMTQSSRVCHSTGSNAINGSTGKESLLCRGARDLQLAVFYRMGLIYAPTDEAWEAKCHELGLP